MKVMKMIVGAEQPKKEQLKHLETVINDVVLKSNLYVKGGNRQWENQFQEIRLLA